MISVIIPIFNIDKYLDRCIKSVVDQSYRDLEIILVDDGSTDNSSNICDEWSLKDNRIKVIHKKNGGLSDARNAGLDLAKGDFIGFVDGDDWIEKSMYSSLLESLLKTKSSVACAGLRRVYDNGFSRTYYMFDSAHCIVGKDIVRDYLRQNEFSTSVCDKLFVSTLFHQRRFPKGRLYEDTPVFFDIICSINKIIVTGKPLYNYFQRAKSICGSSFSRKKLDYYFFSKDVYSKVSTDYSNFVEEGKDFLCVRICELIYFIQESNNAKEFYEELVFMRKELNKYNIHFWGNSNIPRLMKIKIVLAKLSLENLYILLRNIIGVRK